MGQRRGSGEGSIHRRSDGRWVAAVDVGWRNGKRRRKYVYGETRREVQAKLAKVREDIDRSGVVADDRMTLRRFVDDWLAAVEPTVRHSTYARYEAAMRLHFVPAWGNRPLSRITAQDVQRLYADRLASGLSPQSVVHLHRILHRAMRQATRWGVVPRNIIDVVDPPRVPRREMAVLTPDEARAFLIGVRAHRLEALFVAAVTTGMRQGELFALQWRDVDVPGRRLTVRRTLLRTPKGGWMFAEPKTTGSTRQIHLSELAIDALRRHWVRQQEERRRAGNLWDDHGLVFTNSRGQPLSAQNVVQRDFYPLLERLGLPRVRFHDLRHTAATLLLSAGVHPKIVSDLLGHSDIGITLNLYSHVVPGLHERAAATFDLVLSPSQPGLEGPADYPGTAPEADSLAVKLAVKP